MGEFTIILMLIVLGFVSGIIVTSGYWEQKAAETSCAQFNPQTGVFEWLKGEQDD